MLPIAPVISSIITFLQTMSLSTSNLSTEINKVVNVLQSFLSFFDRLPRIDSRIQLVITGYVIPFAVLTVLIVPFYSNCLYNTVFFAVFLVGLFLRKIYISVPLAVLLLALPLAVLFRRMRKGNRLRAALLRDRGEEVAHEVRQYYMTGIVSENGKSCTEIEEMMCDFINNSRFDSLLWNTRNTKRVRFRIICPAVSVALSIALGISSYFVFRSSAPVLFFFLLAMFAACLLLSSVFGVLRIFVGPVSAASTLFLRVAIVVLETLYIPSAELIVSMLHPYRPCDYKTCVAAGDALRVTEKNYTCLPAGEPDLLASLGNAAGSSCNQTSGEALCRCFRRSPFQQPWLDYDEDIARQFFFLLFAVLLALIVGLPLLELVTCRKCRRIIENCGTTGATPEEKYEGILCSLRTPLIYTFFMYKEKYIYAVPAFLFLYKAILSTLSHVQLFFGTRYAVPAFLLLASILSACLRVHRYAVCQILDTTMYVLSFVVSALPLLSGILGEDAVGKACSIAKGVSACIPVAIFALVFILLAIRKKKEGKKSEVSIEDVVEDGEVLRDRMEELYREIDRIINREVLDYIGFYSFVYLSISSFASGFFFSKFIPF